MKLHQRQVSLNSGVYCPLFTHYELDMFRGMCLSIYYSKLTRTLGKSECKSRHCVRVVGAWGEKKQGEKNVAIWNNYAQVNRGGY